MIKNFSRLLGNRTQHNGAQFYCFRCLHGFPEENLLKKHTEFFKNHAAQIIRMPEEDNKILKFSNIYMQHPIAFTIYADFESLLQPISTAKPTSQMSFVQNISHHIPCGYAYVIIGPDGKSVKLVQVYRGENAVQHFLEKKIIQEKDILGETLLKIKPMKLTAEEERVFRSATLCSICQKPLTGKRVRDHNHITGAFRGASHSYCNLNYKQSKRIPVIFHNLKNYDGHHLMSELGKFDDYEISVIASTLEKYITFRLKKKDCPLELVFLDSFQFLPTSLEKLVSNITKSDLHILKEHFPQEKDRSLLTRKGVYPYDYFSSFGKFNETQLPEREAFFNSITEEDISDAEYQHAQNVWKHFKLQTLGQYHDLYVQTDVLLLADVFENFRKLCMHYYTLDAAHLYTSPGLSWQSCLKMCNVQLELLTDIDMLLCIEKGVRGGVSQISHRLATANHPKAPKYDKDLPNSYIMYWDANNLYGWSMSQYLPYGSFSWVSETNITKMTKEFIMSISDESSIGYFFEVDLDYPIHLHDSHNHYPLAPEKLTVTEDMLSNYAKSLLADKSFKGTPKLIPNLYNKRHYIVHYRTLKLYLDLGLGLVKVHRVLQFRQAPWLERYIDFNTNRRKEATSTFEKDFFKLLNNSVYGKTIENLRKRRQITLCNKEASGLKLISSPNFKNFKEFSHDLVAVERSKPTILMNRPIYVGFSILELSKYLMYRFHYKFIHKIYGEKATLLFTDTDSLTYLIETENIYNDMDRYKDEFDFSDYPTGHFLKSDANKKVLGKFKDELNGEQAHQFVGLKSKMYSLKSDLSERKRAKGVSSRVIRSKVTHEDYLNCLKEKTVSFAEQTRIAQQSHQLYTMKQNKKCLSPFDDKRYLFDDGVKSYAYGHYKIPEKTDEENL